jgi:tRNA pseudouridine38-40 synthase
MRIAFRLGWWGAGFAGSQRQSGERTVEGELIRACIRTKIFADPYTAGFWLSGRTDRGVHARAQVGALTTDHPERVGPVLNRALEDDVWITGTAPVHDDWHPRYDVSGRTYRYFFADPSLDRDAMDRAAARFVGEHDVSRFCRAGSRNPVRRIAASRVFAGGTGAVFEVTARSFLWHQVRCMAAALETVGRGELDEGGIDALLSGECRRNPPAAPADRLVLWAVGTPFSFTPVSPNEEHGAFLRATADSHRTRAAIADLLEKE